MPGDLARLRALVAEEEAVEVVLGLPRSLSGGEGPGGGQGAGLRRGTWPARVRPVPVRLCDERLSTVTAEAVLRDRGRKGQQRRAVVDQAAAVVILQNALDTERGTRLGRRVSRQRGRAATQHDEHGWVRRAGE